MTVLIPLKKKYREGKRGPAMKSSSSISGTRAKSWMDDAQNKRLAQEHRTASRGGAPPRLVIRNGRRVWERR